jgi:hypothetical protein
METSSCTRANPKLVAAMIGQRVGFAARRRGKVAARTVDKVRLVFGTCIS